MEISPNIFKSFNYILIRSHSSPALQLKDDDDDEAENINHRPAKYSSKTIGPKSMTKALLNMGLESPWTTATNHNYKAGQIL